MDRSAYLRLLSILSLDFVINVPLVVVALVNVALAGSQSTANLPYGNWNEVHHAFGGFGNITTATAEEWSSSGKWIVFTVKWDEWVYVLHALVFFGVFGTTPEMVVRARNGFWLATEYTSCGTLRRPKATESTPPPDSSRVVGVSSLSSVEAGYVIYRCLHNGMLIFSAVAYHDL